MKIAIIKLGALGDVVRTLPILIALRERYPDSEIHWVTKENALSIFENNPDVDKVLTLEQINDLEQAYDLLYNFDIEPEATQLAEKIKANKKHGFYQEEGFATAFNLPAEYYLNTLFDDELKKSNKKTYQQMMFDAAELPYNSQPSSIFLSQQDKQYALDFAEQHNLKNNQLIGIHIGASSRWPSKAWHKDNLKKFILKAKQKGYEIILFAGKEEQEKLNHLIRELKEQGISVPTNNPNNTLREFASLVNLCNVMICSDSLSLHISLALKKPTIGLFFCTSPNEVEDYGILKKVVSPNLYEFFPEKSDQYSEELVKSITSEEVFDSLEKIINKNK